MKQSIITIMLLFIIAMNLSFAQSGFYLKVYQNSDFNKRTENLKNDETGKREVNDYFLNNYNRISIGIGFQSSSIWYHEMEISYINDFPPIEHSARTPHDSVSKNRYYSFQYEINKVFISKKRLEFSTGIGLNIYHGKTRFIPKNSTQFLQIDNYTGSTLNLVPRISYKLTSNLNIELSSKFGILDGHNYNNTVHNPAVPIEQQKQVNKMKWNFFPSAYNLRLGMAYRIEN